MCVHVPVRDSESEDLLGPYRRVGDLDWVLDSCYRSGPDLPVRGILRVNKQM